MPVLYITLEETQKSILRSCFFSIIKDVVRSTGIPCDTIIAMHHGVEVNKTDNRVNATVQGGSNLPATVSQRRVTATIIENYDEDSLTSTVVSQRDTHPIFHDGDIDVSVYPVYVKSMVTIELEYSCGSKTEAQRVRDDIRVKLSQGRNILNHEVEYDILIPQDVQSFIGDVYDLKSRLFPQSLSEYFLTYSTKHVRPITDMANPENTQLAILERQVRIVGILEFSPEPPPIESNYETNTHKLVIPYKFTIDVPRGMCMAYPPMICNKLMPAEYLQFVEDRKVKTQDYYRRNISSTDSLGALSHFEASRQIGDPAQEHLPLNLPLFDEYHQRVSHPGYVITSTLLTDVNEDDNKGLINLKELGDFYMDTEFLEFLVQGERLHVVTPRMSYFFIGLSQAGKHYDNNILTIDQALNVSSKLELSLLKPVRLTISLCLDTTSVTPGVFERFKSNKSMYLLYLCELIRGISNYKSEFSRMQIAENTFYRYFILILLDATNKQETSFIIAFFAIFVKNRVMMQTLVGYLRNNYPKLYATINKTVDIDRYKYNDVFGSYATGVESYAMRSVMNYARIAYRRTSIDDNDIPSEFEAARRVT